MKKAGILIILLLFAGASAFSQKYAFVDTDYIMKNIPEYTDAQEILDELAADWQKEIEALFAEVDKLYKEYQAEAILLPEDLKKQRENEIVEKEKEAKDLQKKRFGKDGDLYKKRLELIQPIQEKVFNAIEQVATTRNFAFVFDKAAGATVLFAQPQYDISDDVLDEIGNVMQTVKRENRVRSEYKTSQTQQGQSQSQTPSGNTNKPLGEQPQQGNPSQPPAPSGGRK